MLKRKDNIYPFNQLAGVGVVFKLIQAISIKLNLDEKRIFKIFRFSVYRDNIRHSPIGG